MACNRDNLMLSDLPRARAKKSTPSTEEIGLEPGPKGIFADTLKKTKGIPKLKNPSKKINRIYTQKAQPAEMMIYNTPT